MQISDNYSSESSFQNWLFVFLLLICLLGLIFIIPGPALAEEKEKEGGIIKLEEIVVTATKTEKNVEDAPGSVTVISKKEIERRNIKTVDEALSELTGIFVKRTKGLMDSTPSVRVAKDDQSRDRDIIRRLCNE
jgi:iron complex outermembrane receptor protein